MLILILSIETIIIQHVKKVNTVYKNSIEGEFF